MMNKLPKIIRAKKLSGKKLRLIATAADGNVGLYCRGTPREEESKYRIFTRSGKMTKGMMGSGGYPLAPNELKWIWTAAKKHRKKVRRKKRAATAIDPRVGRDTLKPKKEKKILLSEALRCQECRRDVRKMSHAHTLPHPEKGHAQTFCCKHVRMMGYKCQVLREEKQRGKEVSAASRPSGDSSHKRQRRKGAQKRHRHSRNGGG